MVSITIVHLKNGREAGIRIERILSIRPRPTWRATASRWRGTSFLNLKHRCTQIMVGKQGFEPWTPCSQSKCASQLRHFPTKIKRTELIIYRLATPGMCPEDTCTSSDISSSVAAATSRQKQKNKLAKRNSKPQNEAPLYQTYFELSSKI